MHIKKRFAIRACVVCAVVGLCFSAIHANVSLPRIFGNDMVIQRDVPVPVARASAGDSGAEEDPFVLVDSTAVIALGGVSPDAVADGKW